ncbi:MAG: cytochrome c3 family protein [Acidobacteriota bacterium]
MRRMLLVPLLLLPGSLVLWGVGVSDPANKHNLSIAGPGPVRAIAEDEICIFCHTPHTANPVVPLWNHAMSSGVTYSAYGSTTMKAVVGQPNGSSKLCLSCHDGTVALGSTVNNGSITLSGTDPQGRLTGASVLGTDVSNDHPFSFIPVTGGETVDPPAGDKVKLDANGNLQCRSCHDPHEQDNDTTMKKFLVKENRFSALCVTCHQKEYWAQNPSSHQNSPKLYSALQGAHTGYTAVDTNGCESCHKPHSATTGQRVLKGQEEATCGTSAGLQCHGGSNVADYDIATEFNKAYTHPTYRLTPSSHDESESPMNPIYRMPELSATAPRHAECPDCHNPHAAYDYSSSAPKGSGALAGVWGINHSGTLVPPAGLPPSVNEYEICFKCHGDSANKPQPGGSPWPPYPARQQPQFNMRLLFDPSNPAYHPVEARGANRTVPSLVPPWTTDSIMYCSDCHDNDNSRGAGGTGPRGPHGSIYKHLLQSRYEMDGEYQVESSTVYALCYRCHSRTSVLADTSFAEHRMHIVDERTPCSICHDPHGISSAQGNPTNNSNLINFDLRFVTPSRTGILRFEDIGDRTGRCYLTCHDQDHDPKSYGAARGGIRTTAER